MADRPMPGGPATDVAALRAIELDDISGDPEQFVRAVERLIEAFRQWAAKHKRNFHWLRAGLIVLSAALPALTIGTSATMRVIAAVVSSNLAQRTSFAAPEKLRQTATNPEPSYVTSPPHEPSIPGGSSATGAESSLPVSSTVLKNVR